MSDDIVDRLEAAAVMRFEGRAFSNLPEFVQDDGAQRTYFPIFVETGVMQYGARDEVAVHCLNPSLFPFHRAADEIERLRSIVNEYDRDRVEYCSKWLQWIKDHDGLDVMEWMMAYANAIPAPNPDGDAPTEIYAAIDARSREAAMEIERLRTRVAELEEIVAGRSPVL